MTSIFVAIFSGVWYWFAASKIGYTFSSAIRQPILVAAIFGIIYGDIPTAMVIGAYIELIYLGMIAPGGNMPADEALAGIIAIPVALHTGMSPQEAVVLSVPLGIVGALIENIRRTGNVKFIHNADKHALTGNTKGIWLNATVFPLIFSFLLRFPPVFLANYAGPEVVQSFLNLLPEWIMHGLNVTGGILPALGFAIVILTLGKAKMIPYFILGYFAVIFLGIGTMAAAIFGSLIAIISVFNLGESTTSNIVGGN